MKIMGALGAKGEDFPIEARSINFVDDGGRVMFSVKPAADGRTIEVRGVDTVFFDGVAFGSGLVLFANASNSVDIALRQTFDRKPGQ